MNTPICDFVKNYIASGTLRLHMPGHKGEGALGFEALDITEIAGADVLYSAEGIIAESQRNASALFGSGATFFSCEGSSHAIRAMLCLTRFYCGEERPLVLAGRNAHKAFMGAASLLDLDVDWLCDEDGSLLSCRISAETLERRLSEMERKPAAVYITSPDYLGNIADIAALSAVAHRHGALLLVDNAHGAYRHFLPVACHPLDLGADMCADSAHKTLSALTPCAYLHIGKDAPPELCEQAMRALELFATTSPSYLLLQSLDMTNKVLAEGYREELAACCERVGRLKEKLLSHGFALRGEEPIKVTLAPKSFGYTGAELAQYLRENGVECEFADPDFAVLMFTPAITAQQTEKVAQLLTALSGKAPSEETQPPVGTVKRAMSIRAASFARSEVLRVEDCLGRVLAEANVSCPPAVPIVACGEVIDEAAVRALRYYGVEECRVVK